MKRFSRPLLIIVCFALVAFLTAFTALAGNGPQGERFSPSRIVEAIARLNPLRLVAFAIPQAPRQLPKAISKVGTKAASVFVVNSTGDASDLNPGDGTCNSSSFAVVCTLRAAIEEANANNGTDTINFNIVGAGGPIAITPTTSLPPITDDLIIDGYSQTGATVNTLAVGNNAALRIVLDGSSVTTGNGLDIATKNCLVKGLVINGFTGGIHLGLDNNVKNNTIEGCFIGTNATGLTKVANTIGIRLNAQANNNLIGGPTPAARNLISGNGTGIRIEDSGSDKNLVQNNYIGTDKNGTAALANGTGVSLGEIDNQIGGPNTGEGNLISGNTGTGISDVGDGTATSKGNTFQGNIIGLNATAAAKLGNNKGIEINSRDNSTVGSPASGGIVVGAGNLIAGNTNEGISILNFIAGDDGISIRGNDIGTNKTNNAGLGNGASGIFIGGVGEQVLNNTIIGNGGNGILLQSATNVVIQQNNIGFATNGNTGSGVFLSNGAQNNIIGGAASDSFSNAEANGNLIAGNAVGVNVNSGANDATGNSIRGNTIESNVGLGIDLNGDGVTANDNTALDADTGDNNLQNYPVITSVNGATISGLLTSTPNTDFVIDFYDNATADPSGFGEGSTGLDSINVKTDAVTGQAPFSFNSSTAPTGTVTATATNKTTGDTSEFSQVLSAPQTFEVDTTSDANLTACTAAAADCSLRGAITKVNSGPGGDTISFNIPGAGVQTISPTSALPNIAKAVTIDGYTQPGSSANTLATGNNAVLRIELNGTNAGAATNGLTSITSNVTLRGLVINRFSGDGVALLGAISSNTVAGCFIGTNAAGTTAIANVQNGVTIQSGATANTVGGTVASARNLISGNTNGVAIFSDGNTVSGNYIGTNAAGTARVANSAEGVLINFANNNIIGGPTALAGNVISGNNTGLKIIGSGNSIQNNFLGTDNTGNAALGNTLQGILLFFGANNNTVGGTGHGNRIAFNGGAGVVVSGNGAGNAIRSNSIFSNTGLGIDLDDNGVTANDGLDTDTGSNNLQNYPVLTGATPAPGSTTVFGTLNSTPNTQFTLEFFSDPSPDASGFGEGKTLVFSTTSITTDANGNVTFGVGIPGTISDAISATATPVIAPFNTSEFSNAVRNLPTLSINDVTLTEGDTGTATASFAVTLSAASTQTVTVGFATANGTATQPADYTQRTGTVTFTPGQTVQLITVPVVGDILDEADETFFVNLTNPTNATITDAQGVGTIADNDPLPTLRVNDVSVTEGNTGTSNATFTVTLSAVSGRSVTVNYATANGTATTPSDYTNTTGTLTIPAGNLSGSIAVPVQGDTLFEANETFFLNLTGATNATIADNQGIGTILNDDGSLIVTTTADNTNAGDGLTSLREAITFANANAGADTISFAIPGASVQTISPTSALPTITQAVTIDGTTQTGYAGTPIVVLNGATAGGSSLSLTISAANCNIKALDIVSFSQGGISITGGGATGNTVQGCYIGVDTTGNTAVPNGPGVSILNGATGNIIGGTTAAARNVISGNNGVGVNLDGGATTGNTISGNNIGTNAAGTAAIANFNSAGVYISNGASNNTIGGTTGTTPGGACTGACNLISGNGQQGIDSFGGGGGNIMQGNFVGTDVTGTAKIPNANTGIYINTSGANDIIGGTTAAARNLISGNNSDGIGNQDYFGLTSGLVIQGNFIGTDTTGTLNLGNGNNGVYITGINSVIGGTAAGAGNVIAFNGASGVNIGGPAGPGTPTGNSIRGNSIFSNSTFTPGSIGIDLSPNGVTPNDAGDGDTGANNLQNFPVITSVVTGANSVIRGNLNSVTGAVFQIDFYSNDAADASGFGEGQTYLGSLTTPTTNASGNTSFTFTATGVNLSGKFISATATDAAGNTSEFSLVKGTNAPSGIYYSRVNGTIFRADGDGSPDVQITTGFWPRLSPDGNFLVFLKGSDPNPTRNDIFVRDLTTGVENLVFDNTDFVVNFDFTADSNRVIFDSSCSILIADRSGANRTTLVAGTDCFDDAPVRNPVNGTLAFHNANQGLFLADANGANRRKIPNTQAGDFWPTWSPDGTYLAFARDPRGNASDLLNLPSYYHINPDGSGLQLLAQVRNCDDIFGVGRAITPDGTRLVVAGNIGGIAALYGIATNGSGNIIRIPVSAGSSPQFVGSASVNVSGSGVTLDGVVVTNTNDSGPGSLRAAITCANSRLGADTITFNIPGTGVQTIAPTSALPNITDPVTINGYSQTGASANTNTTGALNTVLRIALDGTNAGAGVNGLTLNSAANCTIRGLNIRNFGGNGIVITGATATNNTIGGNFIGTNVTGTSKNPNATGVQISNGANGNTIGGNAASRNLISGNSGNGIFLNGTPLSPNTTNNLIVGNLIGTNATVNAQLGNASTGVLFGASTVKGNTIGGTSAIAANIISGNGTGVVLTTGSQNNLVKGNFIGTDALDNISLGNSSHGIVIGLNADNNIIGSGSTAGNIISGNGGAGVQIAANNTQVQDNTIGLGADGITQLGNTLEGVVVNSGTGNSIRRNRIGFNGRLGINLAGGANELPSGVTPNDTNDPDTGPNNLQNFPTVTSAQNETGGTRVRGTIASTPSTAFIVEFFDNTVADGSGFGEGQKVLSAVTVTTNASSQGTFNVLLTPTVPIGHFITATATDPAGNTSEFTAVTRVIVAPPSFEINSTADTDDGACTAAVGGCTFREAINAANAAASADKITFNIPGTGIHTITPTTALPVLTNPGTIIDGSTQPGFTGQPHIVLSGVNFATGTTVSGLSIQTSGCTARSLNLVGWSKAINISGSTSTGNRIESCFIGTNSAGTAVSATPNGAGIVLSNGAANNFIGGDRGAVHNVISGSTGPGILITGTGTKANNLQGNLIGTNNAGTVAIGNDIGIRVEASAASNVIGGANQGTSVLLGNIISGNKFGGVLITGAGSNSNRIEGNLVGLNAVGAVLGNGDYMSGIEIANSASGNIIGGTTTGVRNFLVAGKATAAGNAVKISGASANYVRGNFIGTNPTGTGAAIANQQGTGITIEAGSQRNVVGGTSAAYGNIISGCEYGVAITDTATTGNAVVGNLIGTNVLGNAAISNRFGIGIFNAVRNTVGGTASGSRNIISGNLDANVYISQNAVANSILGNFIGTNVTGTASLGAFSTTAGVWIDNGANGNVIGGTTAAARNIISGNAGHGVLMSGRSFGTGSLARSNRVTSNFIGLNVAGIAKLPNGSDGIAMEAGAVNNVIGVVGAFGANIVSGNGRYGISMSGLGTNNNTVQNNRVGLNPAGNAVLGNTAQGIVMHDGAQRNRIGGDVIGTGNIVAGNGFNGIGIGGITGPTSGQNTAYNVVQGNLVGTDASGNLTGFGNAAPGIAIAQGAHDNLIGGLTPGSRNVISGNNSDGIFLGNPDARTNRIQGNYIGIKADGSGALPNTGNGITLADNARSNFIGGTGGRNIISGNAGRGISITGTATTNVVASNYIGTNISGTAAIGNTFEGVNITDASGNLIGGSATTARNIISGNALAGVALLGGAKNNSLQGNYIGMNAAGTAALPNVREGVFINSSNNTIGGVTTTPGKGTGNVIAGNTLEGVHLGALSGAAAASNRVFGNLIGTNAAGTAALPNFQGVLIDGGAKNNSIGGGVTGTRNVISGNTQRGILISAVGTTGNRVEGNYVGTNLSGTGAVPNQFDGITIAFSASNNIIGGLTNLPGAGAGNLVSGNLIAGVTIEDQAINNSVFGNAIGVAANKTSPLPNQPGTQAGWGVLIVAASNNTIGNSTTGANLIATNSGPGIGVNNAPARGITASNRLRGNSMFNNGGLGIDLNSDGVTNNDVGDTDGGANNLQNYPVLTSATQSSPGQPLIVKGTIGSTVGHTFTIDAYSNNSADPSGFGEGQTYLGSFVIGNGAFNKSLNVTGDLADKFISLTATDNTTSDTSEFSKNATVSAPVAITVTISPNSATLNTGGTQPFTATVGGTTNQNVTWSVDESAAGGTITAAGLYTAPTTPGTYKVRATSIVDNTVSGTATVTVVNTSVGQPLLGWGYNQLGSVGDGSNTNRLSPGTVNIIQNARLIASGGSHNLAVAGNVLYAWGNNDSGQLGDGSSTSRNQPVTVKLPTGIRADGLKAIACGWYHSVAITADNQVLAWGFNRDGQCGVKADTPRFISTPRIIAGLKNITAISGGTLHTLALDSSGKVWAFGNNFYGQLGNGTIENINSTPTIVANLPKAQAIGAGGGHSVALLSDGTAMAWGWDFYGQLGDGVSGYLSNGQQRRSSVPMPVKNVTSGAQLSVGYSHSLILKSDGTLMGWGDNFYGQLGRTTTTASVPLAANVTDNSGAAFGNVKSVVAGSGHNLVIRRDGTIWSWGYNEFGNLGLGTSGTDQFAPQKVPTLLNGQAVAAGYGHSIVIATRGAASVANIQTNSTILKNGTAYASNSEIMLLFSTKLKSIAADGVRVLVNGNEVEVQNSSISGSILTIVLPQGALKADDEVIVSWSQLKTQSGESLNGNSPAIVVE